MRTPIKDEGATARERRPATRQFTGSALLALRIVPERELKMIITRLAATASWIRHPPAYKRPGTKTIPPPTPTSPESIPPMTPMTPRNSNSR
jgi:hypothetical protein